MEFNQLKQDQRVEYVDKHAIHRKGTIQRASSSQTRCIGSVPQYFITVKSDAGDVEVIQDLNKITDLI